MFKGNLALCVIRHNGAFINKDCFLNVLLKFFTFLAFMSFFIMDILKRVQKTVNK